MYFDQFWTKILIKDKKNDLNDYCLLIGWYKLSIVTMPDYLIWNAGGNEWLNNEISPINVH